MPVQPHASLTFPLTGHLPSRRADYRLLLAIHPPFTMHASLSLTIPTLINVAFIGPRLAARHPLVSPNIIKPPSTTSAPPHDVSRPILLYPSISPLRSIPGEGYRCQCKELMPTFAFIVINADNAQRALPTSTTRTHSARTCSDLDLIRDRCPSIGPI